MESTEINDSRFCIGKIQAKYVLCEILALADPLDMMQLLYSASKSARQFIISNYSLIQAGSSD